MKILFTCHYHRNPNAGAFGVTWRLGQEYQRLGHDVAYYSLDDLPQTLHPLAKVAAFPEFVAYKAATLARQGGLDVVDASTGDSWVWSLLQKMRGDRPSRSRGVMASNTLNIWNIWRNGSAGT